MRLPAEIAAILSDPLWLPSGSEEHGPAVGFLSNNVPVELIHAAGCVARELPTAPRPTPRADRYMEARFDPIVRVALERLLAGELSDLRLLVLPRSVDSLQRLYYYLCELRRSFDESVPDVVLYDVLQTPWYSSAEYTYGRTGELRDRLSALGGQTIDDPRLAGSIRLYNEVRASLASLLARRWRVPAELSGETAFALLTAAQRVTPEVFLTIAAQLVAESAEAAPGVRTLLVGSAHDTPALHRLIARAGGQVVADYHARGDLALGPAVDESLPPLRAISTHYQRHSPGVRSYPTHDEPLLALADKAQIEAAVFFYYAEEEALTWDLPAQTRALAALGVPALRLTGQPYPAGESLLPTLHSFFEQTMATASRALAHGGD